MSTTFRHKFTILFFERSITTTNFFPDRFCFVLYFFGFLVAVHRKLLPWKLELNLNLVQRPGLYRSVVHCTTKVGSAHIFWWKLKSINFNIAYSWIRGPIGNMKCNSEISFHKVILHEFQKHSFFIMISDAHIVSPRIELIRREKKINDEKVPLKKSFSRRWNYHPQIVNYMEC